MKLQLDRRRNTTKSGQNRSESLCAGLSVPCRILGFGVAQIEAQIGFEIEDSRLDP